MSPFSSKAWIAVAIVIGLVVSAGLVVGGSAAPSASPAGAAPVASSGSVASSAPTVNAASASSSTATTVNVGAPLTPAQAVSKYMSPGGVWDGPLPVDAQRVAAIDAIQNSSAAAGLPSSELFPPSIYEPAAPPSETGGHIIPTVPYPNAPAPMGLAYYGLQNESGQTVGTVFNTTALESTFSTNDNYGLQGWYPYYDGATSFGGQLNAVLVNVTLSGTSSDLNQFWQQNVIGYNAAATTNQLSFENNIWNFSNPASSMPSATILKGNGRVSGGVYETSGPRVTIAYPFSFTLYINTTVNYSYSASGVSCATYGCNEVYYNYSIYNGLGQHVCPTTEPTGDVCGMYDNVIYRSQSSTLHTYVTKSGAEFQANGLAYNPFQYLPNDYEWDIGIGSSDGAEMTDWYSNVTLGLYYLNASSGLFQSVPSAYDYGSETGESGIGADVSWQDASNGQPYAYMTTGPSILHGLWNISAVPIGYDVLNYAGVTPGNAFIAVGLGANLTNESFIKVAPTFGWYTPHGAMGPNMYLSPGTYTVWVLLSGYVQEDFQVTFTAAGQTYDLVAALQEQASPQVYTPLYAFSSSDLANLSSSGDGTIGNPYVLFHNESGSLSGVFSDIESYFDPVWTGIYLNGTTAYVDIQAPSLQVTYPSWLFQKIQNYSSSPPSEVRNLPLNSQLQIYFYHAQNVTLAGSASIGGWFVSESYGGFGPLYNVYVNDGKNILVANNFFNDSAHSLEFLSGGTDNYVWGNTFVPWVNTNFPALGAASTALTIAESGDHIYDNAFYTNGTAAASSSYTDFWNATGGYQPSTNSITVNGYVLSGSILGQTIQGGNYWFNYGTVANPYGVPYVARASSPTGSASIGKGADYAPLSYYMNVANGPTVPSALGTGLYAITFSETGLLNGNSWAMRVAGVPVAEPYYGTTYRTSPQNTSTVSAIVQTNILYVPNGTYTWTQVTHPTNALATVTTGSVTVSGAGISVSIAFQWTIRVHETGLPASTRWASTFGGVLGTTTGNSLNFTVLPGTYAYTISSLVVGWVASPASGSTTVASFEIVNVTFTASSAQTYALYFTESGLPAGTVWSVTIGSTTVSGSTVTLSFSLTPGTYTYTVNYLAGYTASPSTGQVTIGSTAASLGVTFTQTTSTVTFTETGLPGGTSWAVQFGGVIYWSTGATISFSVVTGGTYTYYVGFVNGYTASPTMGSSTVTGPTNISVTYTA